MASRKKTPTSSKKTASKQDLNKPSTKKSKSRKTASSAKKIVRNATSQRRGYSTRKFKKMVKWKDDSASPRCVDDIGSTGFIGWNIKFNLKTVTKVRKTDQAIQFDFQYGNGTCYNAYTSVRTNDVAREILAKLQENHSYVVTGTIWAATQLTKFKRNSNAKYSLCLKKINVLESSRVASDEERKKFETSFDSAISNIREKKSFELPFGNLTILNGDVYRYMGCNVCTTGISRPEIDGKFHCRSRKCKTKSGSKIRTRMICTIIRNTKLRDAQGITILGPIIFHEECVKLFGDSIVNDPLDSKVEEAFRQLFGKSIRTTLQHEPCLSKSTIQPFDAARIILKDVIVNSNTTTRTNLERLERDNSNDDNNTVNFTFSGLTLEDDSQIPYDLKANERGFYGLAMIVNINSDEGKNSRQGSEKDVIALEHLLPLRGIEIFSGEWGKTMKDITQHNIQQRINDFRNKLVTGNYSFCLFIFMSHGQQNFLQLLDESEVNIYTGIMCQFFEDVFKQFCGKPKVFIFQACQNASTQNFEVSPNSRFGNMVWITPCLPGQSAIRDIDTGTIFIQSLVKSLSLQETRDRNLDEVFYEVQADLINHPVHGIHAGFYIPVHHKCAFRPFILPRIA